MTLFDQRGQHVDTQYNAQTMDFGGVQTRDDLVQLLEVLCGEVDRAALAQALDRKTANEVQYRVDRVATEAQEPKPDKVSMVQSLTEAKGMIEKLPAAAGALAGLVTVLSEAAQQIPLHFR
jgi:hypothetical protein